MSRKKKPRMEYRYYEVPEKCPVRDRFLLLR